MKSGPYTTILGAYSANHQVDRPVVQLLPTVELQRDKLDDAATFAHLQSPELHHSFQVPEESIVSVTQWRKNLILETEPFIEKP